MLRYMKFENQCKSVGHKDPYTYAQINKYRHKRVDYMYMNLWELKLERGIFSHSNKFIL